MNPVAMMRQVQEMQAKVTRFQEQLSQVDIEGQAGGGAVRIVLSGVPTVRKVVIAPGAMTPESPEDLEDLVAAALGDALAKLEAYKASETEKMMGGIKLPPGMKLPL